MNDAGIASYQGKVVRFDANGDPYSVGHNFWTFNNQPSGQYAFKQVNTYTATKITV